VSWKEAGLAEARLVNGQTHGNGYQGDGAPSLYIILNT